jgi:LysM repeat protein
MEAGYDDDGPGQAWSGVILVVAVLVTVFGGVLLAVMDTGQMATVASPTTEAVALPSPTDAKEQVIITLPTAEPQPTAVPTVEPKATETETPEAEPTASPTAEPTDEPTAEPTQTSTPEPSNTPEVILERCTPPEDWIPYTVRYGDTLFFLTRRAGVDLDTVREANCLTSDELYSGNILYLPTAPAQPTPGCGPPLNWVIYTVQPGDTLYSLATRNGVLVSDVVFANCLPSVSISAGMRLYLPSAAAPPAPTTPAATAEPSQPTGTVCLISSPADGSQVSGAVAFSGSANTEDFLFYKLEASGPQTGGAWASLLGSVVYSPVTSGYLGAADLTLWAPGSYSVRLVVVDSTSNEVVSCFLGIEIVAP